MLVLLHPVPESVFHWLSSSEHQPARVTVSLPAGVYPAVTVTVNGVDGVEKVTHVGPVSSTHVLLVLSGRNTISCAPPPRVPANAGKLKVGLADHVPLKVHQ